MERLTPKNLTKACNDSWDYCGLDNVCKRDCRKPTPCKIPAQIHRLAEYEDTELTPNEISYFKLYADIITKAANMPIEELLNLVKDYKAGRMIELSCKVGDTVFTNQTYQGDYERQKDKPYRYKVVFIGINGERDFLHAINEKTERMCYFNFPDIGKTVFLTPEAAQKALEEGTK